MSRHYVLAIDQGTTSTRAIVFDRDGRAGRQRPAGARSSITRSDGWVEHDPGGHLARHARGLPRRRSPRAGVAAARDRRASASPTSARPPCCGSAATGKPVHRAIVWQDRRTAELCRRLDRRRARGAGARAHRPGRRRLLLRHQARLAARQRAGRARSGRARRAGLRHRSTASCSGGSPAARCTPPTPPTPRAPCCSTSTPGLGRRAAAALAHPARGAAGGAATAGRCSAPPTRPVRRRRSRSPASPATSRRRPSARPASRRAWSRAPTAPAASCWSTPASARWPRGNRLLTTVAYRLGGRDHLRARGQHLRRRRRGAVAARRAEADQPRRRERAARGRRSAITERRLSGAGLHGPRRAALGPRRARRDPRPDPRHRRRRTSCARRSKRSAYQTAT